MELRTFPGLAAQNFVDIPPFEGSCWTGWEWASLAVLGVECAWKHFRDIGGLV